jgi:hypothetical protein
MMDVLVAEVRVVSYRERGGLPLPCLAPKVR